jgi:hypothetical protein
MAGGGDQPPRDCETDGECVDDSACNGVESCVAGQCRPGTAVVCVSADPEHCSAECVEGAEAQCRSIAFDVDEDGHGTVECIAAPGDDCDDARNDVFLGAPEICDRVDNDCDMLVDLDEDLPLSGTVRQIGTTSSAGRRSATVAWSPVSSVYGLLWIDPALNSTQDLYYVAVDQDGIFTGTPKALNTNETVTSPNRVGLSWGGDYFSVAWVNNAAGVTTYQREITSGGDPISVQPPSWMHGSTGVEIAHTSDGSLGAIWERVDQGGAALFARSMTSANVLGTTAQLEVADVGPYEVDRSHIAAVGNGFVVTWDADNLPKAVFADAEFRFPVAIPAIGRRPTVGSGPDSFAFAANGTAADSLPLFQILDPAQGTVVCGPVTFADAEFSPEALIGTDRGYLVVSRGHLRAQEIGPDCTPRALFEIDPGNGSGVRIAHGNAGFTVVWQDTSLGAPKFRQFGENFCD